MYMDYYWHIILLECNVGFSEDHWVVKKKRESMKGILKSLWLQFNRVVPSMKVKV